MELLRTTTAEPTAAGIEWFVDKDISIFANYLKESNIAYLSIPNNIDSTYTGIPSVTITLTFYQLMDGRDDHEVEMVVGGNSKSSSLKTLFASIPDVLPLTSSPGNWNALTVSAGSSLSYDVVIPHDDVVGVKLLVMASGHGCEEFWYTNIDNDTIASLVGLCGGGTYREIQVYVDGLLAGAVYPFPVIYTGGINPFLWRPLTGIMSFDIPAYEFDLSPFILGDGDSHHIQLSMYGGDKEGGVWYLDGTLLLYRDPYASPISGSMSSHYDSKATVLTTSSSSSSLSASSSSSSSSSSSDISERFDGYHWTTVGGHMYTTTGTLKYGRSNKTIAFEVTGAMNSTNTNDLLQDAEVQLTSGWMYAVHNSSVLEFAADADIDVDYYSVATISEYPYEVNSTYMENNTTFDMTASVSMSYAKSRESRSSNDHFPKLLLSPSTSFNYSHDKKQHHTSTSGDADGYVVSLVNDISSVAAYNRSIDHSVVYKEEGDTSSSYLSTGHLIRAMANHVNDGMNNNESSQAFVYVGVDYDRMMSSADGHVLNDTEDGSYVYPDGSYICGYSLCDSPSASTLPLPRVRPCKMKIVSMTTKEGSARNRSKNDYLPVRHPLMGKKKLSLLRVD